MSTGGKLEDTIFEVGSRVIVNLVPFTGEHKGTVVGIEKQPTEKIPIGYKIELDYPVGCSRAVAIDKYSVEDKITCVTCAPSIIRPQIIPEMKRKKNESN